MPVERKKIRREPPKLGAREKARLQETYVDLGFENLMKFVYGYRHRIVAAGWTRLPLLKRSLEKLFRTLAEAADRNVHGDDAHRAYIKERCETAAEAIRRAKSKDAASQTALHFSFEIIFLLLGKFPRNWDKERAGYLSTVDLGGHRTLVYARTAEQRLAAMIDYAFVQMREYEDSLFARLNEARRKSNQDPTRMLRWIRANEPVLWARFNPV